jgi:hypothetical protein
MKVLLASVVDFANAGYLFQESLKAVGVEAIATTTKMHTYGFEGQARFVQYHVNYLELLEWADIVIFMHSQMMPGDYSKKKTFVFHGGTNYRLQYRKANEWFNKFVDGTLIQTGELLGLGVKNEHWLLPPVDVDRLQPDYKYYGHKFAHYPSDYNRKGTNRLANAMEYVGLELHFDHVGRPWEHNIKRMSECDIYVEAMGHPREWGITALESAALGDVTITQFETLPRYKKEYGECELVVANTDDELLSTIKDVSTWSKEKLLKKKKASRKWVKDLHSYEAIGKRLRGILECQT